MPASRILGSLLSARTIIGPRTDDVLDRAVVNRALTDIDVLFVTTQVFNLLVDRSPEALDHLRLVLFGGERVSPRHVRAALGRTRVVHAYGPTETTVFATMQKSPNSPTARMSRSVPDFVGRACTSSTPTAWPMAAQGELVIGGTGLMRGYRDQPDASARAMVSSTANRTTAVATSSTWTRTACAPSVGRADRQVKISGFRIDLFEIEVPLSRMPRRPGRIAGAFAVADQGKAAALRDRLHQRLGAPRPPAGRPATTWSRRSPSVERSR